MKIVLACITLVALAFGSTSAVAGYCSTGTVTQAVENGWQTDDFFFILDEEIGAQDDHNDRHHGYFRVRRSALSPEAFDVIHKAIHLALLQGSRVRLWTDNGSCTSISSVTTYGN